MTRIITLTRVIMTDNKKYNANGLFLLGLHSSQNTEDQL